MDAPELDDRDLDRGPHRQAPRIVDPVPRLQQRRALGIAPRALGDSGEGLASPQACRDHHRKHESVSDTERSRGRHSVQLGHDPPPVGAADVATRLLGPRIAGAHAVEDIRLEGLAIEAVIARFYAMHGAAEA